MCTCTHEYETINIQHNGTHPVLPHATGIIISNCSRVYIHSRSINTLTHLRTVTISNVSRVHFYEHSLQWSPNEHSFDLTNPGVRILIENSTIDEIPSHTFRGRIDEIVLRQNDISFIRPFAFSSLRGVKRIELINNTIRNIDIQSFKKFSTDRFVMEGGLYRSIPSRMLSDLEIPESFIISSINVASIASMAFIVNGVSRLQIENNVIGILETEAFRITTSGPVVFRNNSIEELSKGAFLGISVVPEVNAVRGLQELAVDNNTITHILTDSLKYNQENFRMKIDGLNLDQVCECAVATQWMESMSESKGSIHCRMENSLQKYFISFPSFVDGYCGSFRDNFWIFVTTSVLLTLVISIIVICVILSKERKRKQKLNIIMPDGKTYRETEVHVIVERAELISTDL